MTYFIDHDNFEQDIMDQFANNGEKILYAVYAPALDGIVLGVFSSQTDAKRMADKLVKTELYSFSDVSVYAVPLNPKVRIKEFINNLTRDS